MSKDSQVEQIKMSELKKVLKEEQESMYMRVYKQYKVEEENQLKIYNIFKNNVLIEDFTYSRRSAIALIFVPAILNLYYLWKPYSPLKNAFRIGSFIGCFFHFNYALKRDFNDLCKKDTVLANKARLYAQNISLNNLSSRSFQKDTQTIFGTKLQNYTMKLNAIICALMVPFFTFKFHTLISFYQSQKTESKIKAPKTLSNQKKNDLIEKQHRKSVCQQKYACFVINILINAKNQKYIIFQD